ncbi:MAG TPA: NrfD/PsrC family molybdoenzyme membrane anchor subunit [Gemmatimonadaceae bacterium]|nr:NrfD/PsrC family molybdoenzyme membrane anchor subunit [Gemmatimonadaceae bacterium]
MARHFQAFVLSALRSATSGGGRYYAWMGGLSVVMLLGAYGYSVQVAHGLGVTGMSDHVSWGLYISNFAFLVGVAAAAVILVQPAYVLEDVDFSRAVLIAEGVAVSALVMCLCFVMANSPGTPTKWWRLTPVIGLLNWPASMLAWDVIMLNGYLALNILIPFYILYSHFTGREPDHRKYVPFVFLSVFWAVSIHLVTAFLFAGLPARPFWNSALLGPRFLASAFTAGPAIMILLLGFIRTQTRYEIGDRAIGKLATATTVAAQINLVMLMSELFYKFYAPTHHNINARYLFFGIDGHHALVPWIWTGVALNVVATAGLMYHPFRRRMRSLMPLCAMLFVGIWIEKGMGLVIPGFIPSPLGEIVEYTPTWVELVVTAGIWALGLFVLTILIRVALPIEMGEARSPYIEPESPRTIIRPRTARLPSPPVRPVRTR